jgi:hypothetical protein
MPHAFAPAEGESGESEGGSSPSLTKRAGGLAKKVGSSRAGKVAAGVVVAGAVAAAATKLVRGKRKSSEGGESGGSKAKTGGRASKGTAKKKG